MFRRAVIILVVVNIAVAIIAAVVLRVARGRASAAMQDRVNAASNLQQAGVMANDDYLKLQTIADGVNRTGTVSDASLDWMIVQIDRPLRKENADIVNVNVLALWAGLKHVPDMQKDKIYKVTVAMLTNSDPADQQYELNKQYAARVQEHIKDSRTIPYLLPLLDSPKDGVKMRAQAALAAMGYKQ